MISPRIVLMDFKNFNGPILQVIMHSKWPSVTIQLLSIIPNTEKSEDLQIQAKSLFTFVSRIISLMWLLHTDKSENVSQAANILFSKNLRQLSQYSILHIIFKTRISFEKSDMRSKIVDVYPCKSSDKDIRHEDRNLHCKNRLGLLLEILKTSKAMLNSYFLGVEQVGLQPPNLQDAFRRCGMSLLLLFCTQHNLIKIFPSAIFLSKYLSFCVSHVILSSSRPS